MAKKTANPATPKRGVQYSMTQAAQMLGVARSTARNMTEDGRLKSHKTDTGRYYYTAEDILAAKQAIEAPAVTGLNEYDLVHDINYDAFIAKVNAKLLEGWALAGGVSTSVLVDGIYYAQAITRPKPL